MMKKKTLAGLLLITLCLSLLLPAAAGETRQAMIELEGMKESIQETLFESTLGFSFWYADEKLEAYEGQAHTLEGVVVAGLYSDDYMVLSMITEEDAKEYAEDCDEDIMAQSAVSRVETDLYRELENGTYYFLTLIAQNGKYLSAVGEYTQEAAEGTAKYFQRVLDSVAFTDDNDYDRELLGILPGRWTAEYEGAETALTLEENGDMSLSCRGADGGAGYTCRGVWSMELTPNYSGKLTLRFTSTENPAYAGRAYGVDCEYEVYTESWVEEDTYHIALVFTETGCSGVSPFEEVYGESGVTLYRKQGPNMRVVKCKNFVSLREENNTSSKRLAKVPLGALVLAFPEYGEKNGFLYCVYHDEYGYILSEYLAPVE